MSGVLHGAPEKDQPKKKKTCSIDGAWPDPESNGGLLLRWSFELSIQLSFLGNKNEGIFSVDINDSSQFFVKRVEPKLNFKPRGFSSQTNFVESESRGSLEKKGGENQKINMPCYHPTPSRTGTTCIIWRYNTVNKGRRCTPCAIGWLSTVLSLRVKT
jgi:hypothetical protein